MKTELKIIAMTMLLTALKGSLQRFSQNEEIAPVPVM